VVHQSRFLFRESQKNSKRANAALYEKNIPKDINVFRYAYEQVTRWFLRRTVNLWWDQTMESNVLFSSFRRRTHLHSGCEGSYLDYILRVYGTDAAYGEMQAMLDAHESTSNTLEFTIAYAAKYPNIQQQIRHEIKAAICDADIGDSKNGYFVHVDILENVKNLPLLRAFVHDVLRVSGTGTWGIPRTNGSKEIWVNGYRIPKNTVICANAEYMHKHNPALWKNASLNLKTDDICLENWLKKNEETGEVQFSSTEEQPFFAFGTGKRICPGREMALKEVYCVLGQLLWNYQIEMVPKENNPHYDEFVENAGTGIQRLLHSPCVRMVPIAEIVNTS